MNKEYRPILPHEKRMWKIAHEPRMYEYRMFPEPDINALLVVALVLLLNRLPDSLNL